LKWTDVRHNCPISVTVKGRTSKKGLMPDALASTSEGLIWYEVDRSARGVTRKEDLVKLIRSVGAKLDGLEGWAVDSTLRRVVVLCRSPAVLRIDKNAVLKQRCAEAAFASEPLVEPLTENVFHV